MNRKNLLLSGIVLMILILVSILPTSVNAAQATTPLYLGITELRKNDTPNMGYAIGNPNDNQTSGNAAKIWNILEYTGPNDSDPEKANGNKNIYCVKSGVGFSDTNKRATYNLFFDMKTERNNIAALNDTLRSIVEGTVPSADGSGTVSKYDALLALSDMLYLIENPVDEQAKAAYLESAGIESQAWDYPLTNDDIAAVQQAAIWYFTNYGEDNGKYDKTGEDTTAWLNYTLDGTEYKSLSDYEQGTQEGYQRQQQAEQLYKYLIRTAKANANNYSNSSTTTGAPAKVNTTSLKYEESGSDYIV